MHKFHRLTESYQKFTVIFQLVVDVGVSYAAFAITELLFARYVIYFTSIENFGHLYFPAITIMTIFFCKINHVYTNTDRSLDETISRTLAALLMSFAILLISIYFLQLDSSRKMILTYGLLLTVFFVSLNIVRWYINLALFKKLPTLLIANETEAKWLVARIAANSSSRYQIVQWTDSLDTIVNSHITGVEAVLLGTGFAGASVAIITEHCMENNIQFIIIPQAFSLIVLGSKVSSIDDIMVFNTTQFRFTQEAQFMKRALDIVVSICALILTAPIMIVVAIGIKFSSPGPVFYTQPRVGKNNQEFVVYKFRSMCDNAEKNTGTILSTINDARLTSFGSFIRKTRLDELPQFFNTLIGNMSVVGPRPERKFFTDVYEKEIPLYRFRHNIKPGITGMAQIYGKYNTAPEFKTLYDLYYISKCQRWGVLPTDISVMLQTVHIFFRSTCAEGSFDHDKIKLN